MFIFKVLKKFKHNQKNIDQCLADEKYKEKIE